MYFYTYILAGRRNGVLYTGSTDDLLKRIVEHREKVRGGFTAKYEVSRLVWYVHHGTRDEAFRGERQIKEWRRAWTLDLIERMNPGWDDLLPTLL